MSSKTAVLLALVCLIGAVQIASATMFYPCDGDRSELTMVEVDQCPGDYDDVCEIDMNKDVNIKLEFKSGVSFKRAIGVATLYNWTSDNIDMCKLNPGTCPGKKGNTLDFNIPMGRLVNEIYRYSQGEFKLEIHNEKNQMVSCLRFQATLL